MPYPDFSDQVYELLAVVKALQAARPDDMFMDPLVELVWILPPGTQPESGPIADPGGIDALFGIPVEHRQVTRPSLSIRPKRDPEPGLPLIKIPVSHALRDYDRGADTLLGRTL